MSRPTMRERFYAELGPLLDADPRTAVVLAVIGASSLREVSARHPDRVIDIGIREQAMVGVAGGLALTGIRPIVHTYAPFLVERAYEQIKLDLGHQDVGAVLVSAGASYDASTAGRTHQAPADVMLMSALPGWTVHVPGHADELARMLHRAGRTDDRVYLRTSGQQNAHALPGRRPASTSYGAARTPDRSSSPSVRSSTRSSRRPATSTSASRTRPRRTPSTPEACGRSPGRRRWWPSSSRTSRAPAPRRSPVRSPTAPAGSRTWECLAVRSSAGTARPRTTPQPMAWMLRGSTLD